MSGAEDRSRGRSKQQPVQPPLVLGLTLSTHPTQRDSRRHHSPPATAMSAPAARSFWQQLQAALATSLTNLARNAHLHMPSSTKPAAIAFVGEARSGSGNDDASCDLACEPHLLASCSLSRLVGVCAVVAARSTPLEGARPAH